MSRITETCSCGASITVPPTHDADDRIRLWRAQHRHDRPCDHVWDQTLASAVRTCALCGATEPIDLPAPTEPTEVRGL